MWLCDFIFFFLSISLLISFSLKGNIQWSRRLEYCENLYKGREQKWRK